MTLEYFNILVGFELSLSDLIFLLKFVDEKNLAISEYYKSNDDEDYLNEFSYQIVDKIYIHISQQYKLQVIRLTHDVIDSYYSNSCYSNSCYRYIVGINIGIVGFKSDIYKYDIQKISDAKIQLEQFLTKIKIKNTGILPSELIGNIFDFLYGKISLHFVQNDCVCCT